MGFKSGRPSIDPDAVNPSLRPSRSGSGQRTKSRVHPEPVRPGEAPLAVARPQPARRTEEPASAEAGLLQVQRVPESRSRAEESATRAPKTWRIRWRLLIGTAAGVFACLVAASFWHARQVNRQREFFLQRAAELERREDWAGAATALANYLRIEPRDVQRRIELAFDYDKSANTVRRKYLATTYYYRALGMAPERTDIAARLCELLVDLGGFASAESLARRILETDPHHPTAQLTLALCLDARHRAPGGASVSRTSVIDAYQSAVANNPGDAAIARRLADLLREELTGASSAAGQRLADQVMDRLVEADPENVTALLARHEYRLEYGSGDPDGDLAAALEIAPDAIDVRVAAGRRAETLGQERAALEHFEEAIRLDPKDRRGYILAGRLLAGEYRLSEARARFERCLSDAAADDFEAALGVAEVDAALGDVPNAEKSLARLRTLKDSLSSTLSRTYRNRVRGAVSLIESRLAVLKGDIPGALAPLQSAIQSQSIARQTPEELESLVQAHLRLGQLHGQLGNWDLSISEFTIAATLSPSLIEAYLFAGRALLAAHRPQEAADYFRRALAISGRDPEANLGLLTALLEVQSGRSLERRDWREFSTALSEVQSRLPNSIDVAIKEGTWHLMQGDTSAALDLLLPVWETGETSTELAQTLVLAHLARKDMAAAEQVVDRIAAENPSDHHAPLLRAEVALARGGVSAAIEALSSEGGTTPARAIIQQRIRLRRLAGDTEGAAAWVEKYLESSPHETWAWEVAGDLALEIDDTRLANKVREHVSELEGSESGLAAYLSGRLALLENESLTALITGARMHGELAGARPAWPKTHILGGHLALARGDYGDAARHFRRAVELGDRDLSTAEKLVATLYRDRQFSELGQFIRDVNELTAADGTVSNLAIAAASHHDPAQAVALALTSADRRPDDPLARIWLAATLEASQRIDDAEAALWRAIELSPKDVRSWMNLIAFLVRHERREAAEDAITKALQTADNAGDPRIILLAAQGFEMLGDAERAAKYFREITAHHNDDVVALERAATFFLDRDVAVSKSCLRRIKELQPENAEVGRQLASVLISQGGTDRLAEARSLLASDTSSAADRRLGVIMLLQTPGVESERLARERLESVLATSSKPAATDRLLLARIHEQEGRVSAAKEQYLALVAGPTPRPDHLAALVAFLLRGDRPGDAAPWLAELGELEPYSSRTLRLQFQSLVANDRAAAARDHLSDWLNRRKRDAAKTPVASLPPAEIAGICADCGLDELAEQIFHQGATSDVEACSQYADFLARRGRADAALRLLEPILQEGPEDRLWRSYFLVCQRIGQSDSLTNRAESFVERQFSAEGASLDTLVALAVWRSVQGRADAAETILRNVLDADPRDVDALNALACLLLDKPTDVNRAESHLEQAMRTGLVPYALWDTKCLCEIRREHWEQADELLSWLERQLPTAPEIRLRRAMWFHAQGKSENAAAVLRDASRLGLSHLPLLPCERELTRTLRIGESGADADTTLAPRTIRSSSNATSGITVIAAP